LAVVEGYGSAQNAYHMVASPPDALGPTRAIQSALTDASLNPRDIGYISAHGTSTRDNDWCETLAVHAVFGDYAAQVPISSSKSELGHTMAAAGAIETVLCVKAMHEGVMPPTINLEEPDPRCDLDYLPSVSRPARLDHVLNNSFGFGGHSTSLVLGRVA
jgi:3-oxoacyl-[acyl-carrier-protein] synthase II